MIVGERRGQSFLLEEPRHGTEQNYSLELPLGYATSGGPPRVAVILHAFYTELLPELRAYLDHIPVPADLFISTDTEEKRAEAAGCFFDWAKGSVEVRVMPNRGRDIAPKLIGFAAVHDRYDYVLHLHTKLSPHEAQLAGWRGYVLDTLLGSPDVINGIFEAFARTPRLGMLAPQHIDQIRPWIRWGENYAQAKSLAARMGFPLPESAPLDFPSGSMFWARSAALRPLLDLHLGFDDFQAEGGQTDGTLAHAIERLYLLICEHAGFDWMKITARGELHEQWGVTAVSSPQDLDRFLARHRLRLMSLHDQERSIGGHPVTTTPLPKPRRVLHVTWRAALGDGVHVPEGRRFVVVLHGAASAPALLASVEVALRLLPAGVQGQVLTMPGVSRELAQQAGFAAGADLLLLIGAPGLLHPQSAAALVNMSEAQEGRALMEVACVPSRGPRLVDRRSFGLSWVSGPTLAIPRSLHDEMGAHGERFASQTAEQDYSNRARALGFQVLLCPLALFYADPAPAVAGASRVA